MRINCLLLFLLSLSLTLWGQRSPLPDSARTLILADVAISDKIARLVVASGKAERTNYTIISPGGGFAVRFGAPRAGYHALSSVRVHLSHLNAIQEGQIRLRAASIAATGSPAADDLLPTPVLLTTAALQHARKNLVISWPIDRVVVPEAGFFIVLEGVGASPDEYASKFIRPAAPKQPVQYELRRRNQPQVVPRLVDVNNFPALLNALPATKETEAWYRDTATQEWHRSQTLPLLFLEAVFE